MSTTRWTDRELRDFVLSAPLLDGGEKVLADVARARFIEELGIRVVPVVQKSVLATVGVSTSPEGVALFACDLVENSRWDSRRDWLLMCSSPWGFLAEWVTTDVVKSHRAATRRSKKDLRVLEGIAEASARRAIDGPPAE
ncbi:hypothetical protein [Frigoribacterium sp. UYMn621]|uniref:hypothetical protein n=1 Tax=Frigoribacterium sp. UYMn621 TaxID=3156343 RepID=UPI0033994A60